MNRDRLLRLSSFPMMSDSCIIKYLQHTSLDFDSRKEVAEHFEISESEAAELLNLGPYRASRVENQMLFLNVSRLLKYGNFKPMVRKLKLAIAINERVPESDFNMCHWACGTSACFVGNYALGALDCELYLVPIVGIVSHLKCRHSDFINLDAAAFHFNLSYSDAYHLFLGDEKTKDEVIADVKHFIEDHK